MVKDGQILSKIQNQTTPKNSRAESPIDRDIIASPNTSNFTLKDVLKGFKKISQQSELIALNVNQNDSVSMATSHTSSSNQPSTTETDLASDTQTSNDLKLKQLLSNNQLVKSKLDEINNIAKRINNNLKLYLIINVLGESNKDVVLDHTETSEDTLICIFSIKYLFTSGKTIENCLCLFTSRQIILFRILDQNLFEKNSDFDKCLSKEIEIEVNQIEVVEISQTLNYLILETVDKKYFKLITSDIYLTQSFLNNLLSK